MNTLWKCFVHCRRPRVNKSIVLQHTQLVKTFCTSVSSSPSSSSKDKYVLFVRHGLTEMNEHLERMPWYSENFFDAALWDTRLSERGIKQAIDAHINFEMDRDTHCAVNKMEVLLSSPLTRALHTAELVFKHQRNLLPANIPHIAHPLLRERLYLSSEVGRSRKELQCEFPHWDLSAVPEDQPWWYVHPKSRMNKVKCTEGSMDSLNESIEDDSGSFGNSTSTSASYYTEACTVNTFLSISEDGIANQYSDVNSMHTLSNITTTIQDHSEYVEWRPQGTYCCEGEPSHVFSQRIQQLKQYLNNRPEQYMVVVAHWGIIRALTGQEFKNCEMKLVKTSEFLEEPLVSDE